MTFPTFHPAAPIDINTVTSENRRSFLEMLRKAEVERVWLCGHNPLLFADSDEKAAPILKQLKYCIDFFRENGFEVGTWSRAFGFGEPMKPEQKARGWTRLRSVTGACPEVDAICPDDPGFRAAYYRMISRVASCKPSLVMLDDDLCLSVRPGIGCFCDLHLARMSEKLGEPVTLDRLNERIFTGKKNRLRDAWLEACADSLTEFCTGVREAVHSIDPEIRVGFCAGYTSWDIEGIDALSLTKVLAGDNKPFLRLTGAPYWVARNFGRFGGQKLNAVIECAREQVYWCENDDVEIFAENDSYPRPAHQIPTRLLEEFSLAMSAIGVDELKYFFDYFSTPTYETLYLRSHCRNLPIYRKLREAFAGLNDCGVRLYRPMRTIANYELPDKFYGERAIMRTYFSSAAAMLTQLTIPVCYSGKSHADTAFGAAFGEDVKYIASDGKSTASDQICEDTAVIAASLPKKLILDFPAAKRLKARGIDVGLLDYTPGRTPPNERFMIPGFDGEYLSLSMSCIQAPPEAAEKFVNAVLSPDAIVESEFVFDDHTVPSSYRYKSGGTEFLVLLFDAAVIGQASAIESSYCRQKQLRDFIGAAFPHIARHPELYCLCKQSADGSKRAVLFENLGDNLLFDAQILLDKPCREFELIGADGELSADKLSIRLTSELHPGQAMVLTTKY